MSMLYVCMLFSYGVALRMRYMQLQPRYSKYVRRSFTRLLPIPQQTTPGKSRPCSAGPLFPTVSGGSGGMAFHRADSKLDAALDYSWSLPLGTGKAACSGPLNGFCK